MNQEDATRILIGWLRNPDHGGLATYGYDVYLLYLLMTALRTKGLQDPEVHRALVDQMPYFYAAAWELCRRGILRPGVKAYQEQSTPGGSSGDGYCITPFGQNWIDKADKEDFVPTEPERFGSMMEPFRDKFGPGFYERSQEAIRCYGAHAYLGSCVLCGAASESILLATAIAKTNDEAGIMKTYESAQGRSRIESILLGQKAEHLQRDYRAYTILLKYWRDASAHGKPSKIGDSEAYTALAALLRLAIFVNDNWQELVT